MITIQHVFVRCRSHLCLAVQFRVELRLGIVDFVVGVVLVVVMSHHFGRFRSEVRNGAVAAVDHPRLVLIDLDSDYAPSAQGDVVRDVFGNRFDRAVLNRRLVRHLDNKFRQNTEDVDFQKIM